jgi:hypothetical protein
MSQIEQLKELIATLQLLLGLMGAQSGLQAEQVVPPVPVADQIESPITIPANDDTTSVFSSGQQVATVDTVNVRDPYGTSGTIAGTQVAGQVGVVANINPKKADGYTWVPVNFKNGADGWVAEDFLKAVADPVVVIPQPPVVTPPASKCELTVTYPNSGERLVQGKKIAVTWDGENESSSNKVLLELLLNGNRVSAYSTTITNRGTFEFVPGSELQTVSGYSIRVTDSGKSSCNDKSDSTFSLVSASSPTPEPTPTPTPTPEPIPDVTVNNCSIPQYTFKESDFDNVISDYQSTQTLTLSGSKWDNTLVKNCNIHDTSGEGIVLKNVDNVVITGCTFKNIGGQAAVRGSISGSATNVTLYKNVVNNTAMNGFNFGQRVNDGVNHDNLRIINNQISNTGMNINDGSTHSMYIQAQEHEIVGNTISGSRDGNGISVRSSGEVSCNDISGTSKASKPGIRYYSDHQTGSSNRLIINQNKVRGSASGINLFKPVQRYDGQSNYNHVVKNFNITNNDVSGNTKGILIDSTYSSSPFSVTQSNN